MSETITSTEAAPFHKNPTEDEQRNNKARLANGNHFKLDFSEVPGLDDEPSVDDSERDETDTRNYLDVDEMEPMKQMKRIVIIDKDKNTVRESNGRFVKKAFKTNNLENMKSIFDHREQIIAGMDDYKNFESLREGTEDSAGPADSEQPTLPGLENIGPNASGYEQPALPGFEDRNSSGELLDLTGLDPESDPEKINIGELYTTLESASDRYAELTAKDRQSYLARFAQEGMLGKDRRFGKLVRRIPGVSGSIDKINVRQSEAINLAIANYETATKNYLAGYAELLRSDQVNEKGEATELSEEDIDIARIAERINIDYSLELSIAASRKEQGMTAGKFTDWWVSQKGFKGNLKKVAVVMGAGFVAGGLAATGIGLLGGAATIGGFGSTLAGGAASAGMALSTTRRRANATVKGSERTIAQTDAATDHEAKAGLLKAAESIDTRADIDYTEKQTDKEMLRNRKRVKISASLGATAGGMAFGLHKIVTEAMNPGTVATSPQYPFNPVKPRVPEVPKPTELLGNNFNVESGHGLTNEWIDWAHTNGHALNSRDAWRLHEAVRNHFGDNGIIDKVGTYVQNGDLRLAKPGAAQWDKGVAEFAKNWLSTQGKW